MGLARGPDLDTGDPDHVAATLPDAVKALIDAPNIAHLGVNTDQGPHVSAVWIDRVGERLRVNTAEGRVKTDAVRSDPRVGISLVDRDDPYRHTVIQGRVVEMVHEGAWDHIEELSQRYVGRAYGGSRDERRVILVIEVESVAGHVG